MVPNSPCQPPWLTWNFWMSTLWQLVGFYVSMPCSQKLCKKIQIHQHQHGTYLALIPLMNFNMGGLTWNPFFLPHVGFQASNFLCKVIKLSLRHPISKVRPYWIILVCHDTGRCMLICSCFRRNDR